MTTAQLRNSVNRSPLRRGFPPPRSYGAADLLIPLSLVLTCFALLPTAQAVGPDTDGSIPGSNNGEGVGVLVSRTTGIWNTGTGFEALNHLTAGNQNTATGFRALFSDTSGGFNTATGVYSLFSNTTGFFNSATGAYSLAHNTTASNNTANGYSALYENTIGYQNTATGFAALYRNTTGFKNTANGYQALYSNTTGALNTATGFAALYRNINGTHNTANGFEALYNNNGFANTANGFQALYSNFGGQNNTAVGHLALYNNISGDSNTALGRGALQTNMTGSGNIALGIGAGSAVTTANDVIAIGALGEDVSNTCHIGNIFGVTSVGSTAVYVGPSGKLGTVVSSRQFKDEIKPMDKASEAILALKPVTFRYKQEIDPAGSPQFGLVAEDVEKVDPDLVVRDAEGKVNTVRYEAVNAMLLNEFLKEHRKVEKLEAAVAQQQRDFQSIIAHQQKQIEALTTGLQKVSAQLAAASPSHGGLELSKFATGRIRRGGPAQRTVFENR